MSASLNTGLTIVSRGEFSIIMANLAKEGDLAHFLQPFAALYVLILAVRAAADKGVGAHLRSLGEAVRMAEGTVATPA